MTKRIIVGLIIAVAVVVGSVLVWRLLSNNTTSEQTTTNTQQTVQQVPSNSASNPSSSPAEPAKPAQSSQYVAYSASAVSADKNTKLLFFHAPWCPQCRALDADITKNISAESGVSIYKVDFDSNQALRQKYGVTLQTTVVRIDDSGNLVEKYVAYNEPTFANVKANLL